MKFDIRAIHILAKEVVFDEFEQFFKSAISKKPETENIPGELLVEIDLIKDRKLFPEMFAKYSEVVSHFDKKFYKEKLWLECYDKLIRLDKYNEESILYIVKYFRKDDFWSTNFMTLLKLRQLNKEKIKYIDFFKERIKTNHSAGKKGFPTGNIIHKDDGKKRDY